MTRLSKMKISWRRGKQYISIPVKLGGGGGKIIPSKRKVSLFSYMIFLGEGSINIANKKLMFLLNVAINSKRNV